MTSHSACVFYASRVQYILFVIQWCAIHCVKTSRKFVGLVSQKSIEYVYNVFLCAYNIALMNYSTCFDNIFAGEEREKGENEKQVHRFIFIFMILC